MVSFTSSQYRKTIWYALDNALDDTAVFAAERLVAEDGQLDNVHLLALCHFRAQRYKIAMHIAQDKKHAGCAYVYAQCCLKLGKFRLGCRALERARQVWPKSCHICMFMPQPAALMPDNHSDTDRKALPDLAAVQCLLGHLYRNFGDAKEAIECYSAALALNPFVWEAFTGLCDLGVNLKVQNIFKVTPAMQAARTSWLDNADDFIENSQNQDPFVDASTSASEFSSIFTARVNTDDDGTAPAAPGRPARRSARITQPRAALARATGTAAAPAMATTPARLSRPRSGLKKDVKVVPDDAERVEAEAAMLSLFEAVALGTFALSRYECKSALAAVSTLSRAQQDTPYVLSMSGRAYFELVRYKESEDKFRRLRAVDPMRVQDMEIYSTLLWHLRKDVELSFLAHELADIDRLAPATWIAIGNSFSLQKDHDQALKCFRRASRLDPTCAYSYTLQGHEHVSNEEYETAQNAFRLAMRAEWRHYNAWYGLGMVFLKTGKFELAEQHFRQAAMINPGNSVLVCCIGMVLEKLRRFDDALEQYDVACGLQPASALPRFKKARLLMSLRRYGECMQELRIVKNLAPDESSVHYLLGRLYKVQGDKQNAIKYFTAALNLDPKASHVIKEAITSLESHDDEDL